MARLLFCLIPAAALAVPALLLHPVIAAAVFVAVFGLGLDMTKPGGR